MSAGLNLQHFKAAFVFWIQPDWRSEDLLSIRLQWYTLQTFVFIWKDFLLSCSTGSSQGGRT